MHRSSSLNNFISQYSSSYENEEILFHNNDFISADNINAIPNEEYGTELMKGQNRSKSRQISINSDRTYYYSVDRDISYKNYDRQRVDDYIHVKVDDSEISSGGYYSREQSQCCDDSYDCTFSNYDTPQSHYNYDFIKDNTGNYDTFQNRGQRSNSSDSAIIIAHNECDFDEKFMSLDSAREKLKLINSCNCNGDTSAFSSVWPSNVIATMSCPSLDTPCVIISDHSTKQNEDSDFNHICDNQVYSMALENLLNSNIRNTSLLRCKAISNSSLYSSTSSLSSLGDDDDDYNDITETSPKIPKM